jgi:hypothetical protein
MTAILADSACPICGGDAKLILPSTAEHVAFTCVVHRDFEVTKAGMERNKQAKIPSWEAALSRAKARAGDLSRPCIDAVDSSAAQTHRTGVAGRQGPSFRSIVCRMSLSYARGDR